MKKFIKKHKWIKVLVILFVILLLLLLAALMFLKLWPAFGGRASAEDRQDYEARTENYRDGRFYNDGDFQIVRETEQTDEHIISWVFQDEYHKVFESGDSGYGDQYEKIHDKYGDFDFVMTDCAQYDVNWPEVHMFPEEAVQAVQSLGAKAAMPIHWGAFALANHPWDDSVERFVAAGEQAGLQIVTPQIGETMNLNSMESSMEHWWKDIL